MVCVGQAFFRDLVSKDPVFDNRDYCFKSRTERYKKALELVKHLQLYKIKYGLTDADRGLFFREAIIDGLPTVLHEIAFVPFIRFVTSTTEHKHWMKI